MNRILKSKYKILDKIAQSPTHITYTGELVDSDKRVIIKIYKRELLDSVTIKDLKKNALSLSKISLNGVPQVLDGDYGWQGFYFVRDYVSGKTLGQIKKPFEIEDGEAICMEIFRVINGAHIKGLFHGFITPDNIFIKDNGSVEIADFCIESSIYSHLDQRASLLMSKSCFLPPEIILGEDASVLSDIYQLGLVMFFIFTGEIPLKGNSGLNCALDNLYSRIGAASSVNGKIPKYLDSIISKCLENEPSSRFENIEQLAECLSNKSTVSSRYETTDIDAVEYERNTIQIDEPKNKPEANEGFAEEESDRISLFKWVLIAVWAAIAAGIIYSLVNIFLMGE